MKDGVNGLVFHNAQQLAAQLEVRAVLFHTRITPAHASVCSQSLLRGFPDAPALSALRRSFDTSAPNATGRRKRTAGEWEWGTWAENWNNVMRPLLLHDVAIESEL